VLRKLLFTKDEKEKASLDRIITCIKYMYRSKPKLEFRTINKLFTSLVLDYFKVQNTV